jgi:xylan 1,4-beta-xylosidase
VVQVIERAGRVTGGADSVLASAPLPALPNGTIYLRIAARRRAYDFYYAAAPDRWTPLLRNADGTILSTKTAGGFVGTLFGLHAYGAP